MKSWLVGLCIILLSFATALAGQIPEWSEGEPAVGAAGVLKPSPPVPIDLPPFVSERVTKETALFYFSPSCPHCQQVMPEVNALASDGVYQWVGIASRMATLSEIETFQETYKAKFEIIHDADGLFSAQVGAMATPNIYVVRPRKEAALLAEGEPSLEISDAYLPFSRGSAGILRLRSHLDAPFSGFVGYQGTLVCGSCHQQEFFSWSISHHARAYHTLVEEDKVDDPKCVGCHVMGLGEATGFQLGDHHSPLRDVGCESCHGPSGPHDGVPSVATEACESCHDAQHSIAFSVEKGLPHIDHYMANDLSEEALRERVQALQDGRLERPLLQFPDEETVGVAVCESCHENTHPKDAHSKAMKRLSRTEKGNSDCVRCHATGQKSGPPSSNISDYRTSEGVGCESCHGPGNSHAESPTKDNIIGLGESCPVCVIEAVCTSCHTPEWDPDWDLEKRLKYYSTP